MNSRETARVNWPTGEVWEGGQERRPQKGPRRDPEGTQKGPRRDPEGSAETNPRSGTRKEGNPRGRPSDRREWRGTGPREVCRDRRGDEDRTEPGDLEKPGESQGGEGSLEDEEGKWTSEADPEAEADERKPGGGNRREARARHPERLSEESTEAERRKAG